MHRYAWLAASVLFLIVWSFIAGAQPAPVENTEDLYRLEGRSFESGTVRITFLRDEKTRKLRAKVAYDPRGAAYFEDFDEVPVEVKADKSKVISLSKTNRFGLLRIEGGIKAKKTFIFWDAPLVGKLFFNHNRTASFIAEGNSYRLQYKSDCFHLNGAGGLKPGLVEIELKYAEDNEDFVYSKARASGWNLLFRHTDYEEQSDVFQVDTHTNGEMRALDQLSREARVVCATRVNAPAGAPALEVRDIPLGTVLGSPMALPVTGVQVVHQWLDDFYKNTRVRIGDVRLGTGAQYFVSVTGPSAFIKFDNDDAAWVQLNLDLRIGSNVGESSTSYVDTIHVQIQDALRAKAPGNGREPPSTLFDVLRYWKDEDSAGFYSNRSDWGIKMDRWQRTFSTFLASKYKGQLVGD
jgi:hypothetical protein